MANKEQKKLFIALDKTEVHKDLGIAGDCIATDHRAAASTSTTKTLFDHGIQKITKDVKLVTDRRVAEYIYIRGHSFAEVESIEFKRIFEGLLGGAYTPPTRDYIANKGLKVIHEKVRSGVIEILKSSNHATLILDGWEDDGGHAIVNCLLSAFDIESGCPRTVFWKSAHIEAWYVAVA